MAAEIDLTGDDAPAAMPAFIDLTLEPPVKRKRHVGAVGGAGAGAAAGGAAAKAGGDDAIVIVAQPAAPPAPPPPPPRPEQQLNCIVCLDDYVAKSPWVTVCGHHAHEACLKTWLSKSATCPKCTRALPASQKDRIHPLFL